MPKTWPKLVLEAFQRALKNQTSKKKTTQKIQVITFWWKYIPKVNPKIGNLAVFLNGDLIVFFATKTDNSTISAWTDLSLLVQFFRQTNYSIKTKKTERRIGWPIKNNNFPRFPDNQTYINEIIIHPQFKTPEYSLKT